MINLRNEIRHLQEKLGDMYSENATLTKRAAVAYSELTPRPNYKQLFLENNMSFDDYSKDNV
jgi:hypothetical protein